MSDNVIQNSFSSGELAPSIFARTDLASYHSGLAQCRNFFVDYRSGVSTRTGTEFVLQCQKTGSRLIPFSQSVTTTYAIEFGDHYCRFMSNGFPVLEPTFSVSTITNSTAAQSNIPGNNFAAGDWVFLTNTNGMPAANGRFLQVGSSSGGIVTWLTTNGGIPLDTSTFGTYTGGATAARVYTISSPYAAADLPLIKFVQSVSVLFITHPSYPPTTLSFFAPTNWVFASITFGTSIATPGSVTLSILIPNPGSGTAANATYQYAVTAIDSLNQESLPGFSPQVTTAVATGNGNIAVVAGTASIGWNAVTGAIGYNVYKAEISYAGSIPSGAAFGFVGTCDGVAFVDSNIVPDFATTAPVSNNNPFLNNNPSVVAFFQQRAYYASSNSAPATFWASKPGAFNNFNFSDPIQPDDEIVGTIVSTQLNSIRHMLPMPGGLVTLTGHAAFTLSTGQGANATTAVTPLNATIVPQAYNGSSDVPPLVINEDILYVQAKGSIVRDLAYNIYAAIYTGTDVSIKSNHLFFNHSLTQWTYAEEPFKVVWAVRDDGIALSLTFMKEQQMIGWARHDTLGLYQSVTSIQEGQVDATYFIVQRFVGGRFVSFIERQMERTFTYGAEDAWCVDCGTRSGLPSPAAGLIISNSTGTVNVTASAAVFTSADIGKVLRAGGGIITITAFTSSTQITGTVTQTISQVVPNSGGIPQPFASGSWSITKPATKFFGLDYLIGQTVSILADGGVVVPQVVAADGSITLASAATKVVAGLGFQCQAQTMPLDTGEPTIQGKRKKISALNLKLANTRGLKAGRTLQTLIAMKDMNISVSLNNPIPLISGDARLTVDPLWDVPGQIWLQVDDPVPATILGIIPEITIGDTGSGGK